MHLLVYEDGNTTVIKAIDPTRTLAAEKAELRPIAEEVRAMLARVIKRVARITLHPGSARERTRNTLVSVE